MKTFFYIAMYFSLIFLIFSCKNNRTEKQMSSSGVRRIKVNVNKEINLYTFDDFFEYSHHVVLETTDSSLISRIDKMQINDGKIYILDKTGAVLIFDMNGHFIKRIYHKGQSGTEYIKSTDFEIDANGDLYICDFLGSKILKYNQNDEFVTAIKLPAKVSSFKLMGENSFAINLCNGSASFGEKTFFNYLYYNDNNIVHQSIPFNPYLQGHIFSYGYGLSSFYSYNDSVFMTSLMNDTIFTVEKNGILTPFIAYDFDIKKPKLSFSKEEIAEYIREQQHGNRVSSIYCFYLFDNIAFISFDYENQTNYVISKINESPLFIGKFGLDKNGLCILPVSYLSNANKPQLVTLIYPAYLEALLKERQIIDNSDLLLDMQKSVEEEDNPILVFYEWKYTE